MIGIRPRCAALLLVLTFAGQSVMADTIREGRTPGGAFYRIQVPDNWNGDLVIWNHGFDLGPIGPVTDMGPLAEVQLLQGFAVAASSYRTGGWALFRSHKDIKSLGQAFKGHFGPPARIFIYGASLGGLVTVQAVERVRGALGNVVGALTYCGVVGGSRNWDLALDIRLLYDHVCEDVAAAAIPGGGQGLPKNSGFSVGQMEAAVNACTGVLKNPGNRTAAEKQRLQRLLALTGIPEEFVIADMAYATFSFADLTHDKKKLKGRQGPGNIGVDYGNTAADNGIERVASHPKGRKKLRKSYTPSGNVGAVKIVALHTDKDGLVVVENESEYASVVPANRFTVGIAVETEPTHCGFTAPEALGAWESLLDWVDGGPQPDAAALQSSCQSFAPIFPGGCRIDPTFAIPDMDARIRPR
jgi:hypothetical protein